jgi:hypothetical protein
VEVCDGLGTVEIPVAVAGETGIFRLQLDFMGTVVEKYALLQAGEDVKFTLPLNENYCYTGEVTAPNGDKFQFQDGCNVYEKFKFCTKAVIHYGSS